MSASASVSASVSASLSVTPASLTTHTSESDKAVQELLRTLTAQTDCPLNGTALLKHMEESIRDPHMDRVSPQCHHSSSVHAQVHMAASASAVQTQSHHTMQRSASFSQQRTQTTQEVVTKYPDGRETTARSTFSRASQQTESMEATASKSSMRVAQVRMEHKQSHHHHQQSSRSNGGDRARKMSAAEAAAANQKPATSANQARKKWIEEQMEQQQSLLLKQADESVTKMSDPAIINRLFAVALQVAQKRLREGPFDPLWIDKWIGPDKREPTRRELLLTPLATLVPLLLEHHREGWLTTKDVVKEKILLGDVDMPILSHIHHVEPVQRVFSSANIYRATQAWACVFTTDVRPSLGHLYTASVDRMLITHRFPQFALSFLKLVHMPQQIHDVTQAWDKQHSDSEGDSNTDEDDDEPAPAAGGSDEEDNGDDLFDANGMLLPPSGFRCNNGIGPASTVPFLVASSDALSTVPHVSVDDEDGDD
jgi:hypothetical protein